MQKLTGMIVYCVVKDAIACYEKEKGKEWKCGIVVDEDTADAFAELYPKQAARKVKRAEFEGIFKVAPPEGDEKNLYVITLKKNERLANGELVPDKYRPRVFEQEGNSRLDVTFTKLPANGSMGSISIDHYESKHGNIARLKNVLVTSMIEYEGGAEYEAGSEFDDEVEAPAPAQKPAAKKPVKPAAKSAADDNSPF